MAAVLRVAVIQIADEVPDAGGLGEEDLPLGVLLGVGRLRAIVNPARRALARARLPSGAASPLPLRQLETRRKRAQRTKRRKVLAEIAPRAKTKIRIKISLLMLLFLWAPMRGVLPIPGFPQSLLRVPNQH